MGKKWRIDHIVARLYNSIGGQYGTDIDHLSDFPGRGTSDLMTTSVAAFTGDRKVVVDGTHEREKGLVFRQDEPLPFNLLSVNVLASTGQR